MVAGSTSQDQLIDSGSPTLTEIRHMIVFEEVRAATVGATPITFVDDPLLACGGVALPSRSIDGPAIGIVDQCPKECVGCESLYDTVSDCGAIVEAASVPANVDDHLGANFGTIRTE
jgi:hypothetical protein